MASITIKDMSVSYNKGKSYVLDKLNLEIKDGEFCVFLGPSGCGKSTAMHCIAGLLHPMNGEIRFGDAVMTASGGKGKDKTFVPPQERNIAMVFQEYALYPNMTVRENMSFALKTKKAPREEIDKRVDYMAKMLSIEQLLDRKPAELSGGQRQRVALGRALVRDPQVFLLDEPLGNLDAKLRDQVRYELKKIQEKLGITTIYVTHDQEEALTLSDRIAVFNKGVIEQIGTPNEVYNHSATEFVCNFIGDINRLETPLVQYLNDRGAALDSAKHNYIRLERLHVNVQPRDGELALDGVVESREYYGLYIKYYINVEGQTLKVIEKNDGVNIYEPGQKVSVVINPSHVMAYEASEEAAHE